MAENFMYVHSQKCGTNSGGTCDCVQRPVSSQLTRIEEGLDKLLQSHAALDRLVTAGFLETAKQIGQGRDEAQRIFDVQCELLNRTHWLDVAISGVTAGTGQVIADLRESMMRHHQQIRHELAAVRLCRKPRNKAPRRAR